MSSTNYELHEVVSKRLNAIEAKLVEFEEYFDTIESILTKIQAVFEHIKERVDLD